MSARPGPRFSRRAVSGRSIACRACCTRSTPRTAPCAPRCPSVRSRTSPRRRLRSDSCWCRHSSGITAFAGPGGVPPHAPGSCTPQTNHTGYWVAGSDGNVYPFGDAPSCGSLVGVPLAQPVVGMAGRSSAGYWLVARDGGVFTFGRAQFFGSTGAIHLNRPIVGMARDAVAGTATGSSRRTAGSSPSATRASTGRRVRST